MDIFLQIAGLCSLSLFLAWRLVPTLTAPFLAISCTAIVHLIFALAHMYLQGKVLMLGLSLLLGGYATISLLRTDRGKLAKIAKPIMILAILLIFFVWHYAKARVVYWDEFYWAAFVKHLVLENGFWNWDSALPRKDSVLLYPPATTILQSLFQPLWHFSEARIAVAESAVLLSACSIVLHIGLPRIEGRLEKCCLILGSFVILRSLGTLVRHYSYLFAYSEAIQLAFYTSLVLMAVFEFEELKKRLLLWGTSLILLVLCKPTGFVLAGFAIGTIALVQLIRSGSDTRTTSFWEMCKIGFLPALKLGLILFISCILILFSWQVYVKFIILNGMQSHFVHMGNHSLSAGFSLVVQTYIKSFFVKSLFSIPYIWHGKYISTNIVFFVIMGIMLRYTNRRIPLPTSSYIFIAYFLVTWIVWLLVHGYVHIRYLSVEEQLYAASFERYIAIVIGPVLLIICILFLQAVSLYGKNTIKRFLKISLIFMIIHTIIFSCMRPNGLPNHIADMHAAALCLQRNIPSGSTYLIVTDNPQYELNNACQLYVMPNLREAYVENTGNFNPHTMRIVQLSLGKFPENFREFVQKYKIDYLLLWHFNKQFLKSYEHLLGLNSKSTAPILLNLKAWRNGVTDFPEKILLENHTNRLITKVR